MALRAAHHYPLSLPWLPSLPSVLFNPSHIFPESGVVDKKVPWMLDPFKVHPTSYVVSIRPFSAEFALRPPTRGNVHFEEVSLRHLVPPLLEVGIWVWLRCGHPVLRCGHRGRGHPVSVWLCIHPEEPKSHPHPHIPGPGPGAGA